MWNYRLVSSNGDVLSFESGLGLSVGLDLGEHFDITELSERPTVLENASFHSLRQTLQDYFSRYLSTYKVKNIVGLKSRYEEVIILNKKIVLDLFDSYDKAVLSLCHLLEFLDKSNAHNCTVNISKEKRVTLSRKKS